MGNGNRGRGCAARGKRLRRAGGAAAPRRDCGALSGRAEWRAAAVGAVALFIGLGIARFSYSPLIPALVTAGWFGAATADFLAGVNLVGYLVGAAISMHWLAHRAPGSWLRAAMLVAAGSLAACALPWGFGWYFVWRLLAGICAGVLMVLAVPTILAQVRPERRGVIGGVIFGGVGLGMIFSGEVIPAMVKLGLPQTWLLLALLVLLLAGTVWRGAAAPPHGAAAPPHGAAAPPRGAAAPLLLLAVAYACNALGFAPHSLFWVDYIARELGRGLGAGGHYYLLFGIGVAAGPLLAGWCGDRFGARVALASGLGLEAVGVGLPLWSAGVAALAVSSLLVGAAGMGATTLTSARTIELSRAEARTRTWGAMTMVFAAAYAGAGVGYAGMFAHLHRYGPVFAVAGILLAVGAVLAALAGGQTVNSEQWTVDS